MSTNLCGMVRLTLLLMGGVASQARAQLSVDMSEARMALAYVEAERGSSARDSLWEHIRKGAAYRRLGERELSMGRQFDDQSFRDFLESDSLSARLTALRSTLAVWERASADEAERRARSYLPVGTPLRATVYVMVKPRPNSFVFDLERDPAIFLYLDPSLSGESFQNTVAHELHHVGYASACRATSTPSPVHRWLSAFGEGWAMLAAAGGASRHPHESSDLVKRGRWDLAMAEAPGDLGRLSRFFSQILDGEMSEDRLSSGGMAFFAERPQGPWYTVGWLMVSTVERHEGREQLMRMLCDPVALIQAYQRIARRIGAPLWDDRLVERLTREPPPG